MDGGLPKWQYVDGRKVVTAPTLPKAKKGYVINGYSDILATKYDVLPVVTGDITGTVLFDVRTPGEYIGSHDADSNTDPIPGNPRDGHIPGAIFLNWADVFTNNAKGITNPSTSQVIQVLKSESALRTLFAGLGITKTKTVLPYCEGGFRSAHVTLLLLGLGYPSARHYYGSWNEWSRQDATNYPIHTGDTP
jgi:thiosulfate/3-mercaptopyruvate sulfurtransferase